MITPDQFNLKEKHTQSMQILVSGQFPSYTHDVQLQSISSLSMETSLFKQQKIPFFTHFFRTKIPTVGAKIPKKKQRHGGSRGQVGASGGHGFAVWCPSPFEDCEIKTIQLLGYPHFRKPPYMYIYSTIYYVYMYMYVYTY